MNLIDIVPKQIHCIFEITEEEIDKILLALDKAVLNYSNPEEQQAVDFVKNHFYKIFAGIKEKLEGKDGG